MTDLPGIGKYEDSDLFRKSTKGFYDVSITKENSDTVTLYINNFYELGRDVTVTLNGRNLNIPEQTIKGCTIKGYGLDRTILKRSTGHTP